MNLVKCPQCGELYSPSYPRCPFCEEDGEIDSKGKSKPKRRIGGRRAGQSARGGLIVVLVLVLALLSWYLFRGNIIRREKDAAAPDSTQSQTETTEPEGPSVPAINPTDAVKAEGNDGASEKIDGENTADGNKSGESKSDNTTTTAPAVEPSPQENVDVSKAQLNKSDFTLGFAGEKYTIKLSGTDAKPTWSIDNANVATLASDGTVTAVANGNTTVHCKVGNRDLTCTVRVRNTGKNAAAAEAPTTAQTVAPVEPAKPGASAVAPATPAAPAASGTDTKPAAGTTDNTKTETPAAATDSGNLYISAFGSKLPQDKGTGYYDCTVKLDGSSLTLKVAGTGQTPVWSSDNASIATVDANGVLKPVSKGTAHITATVGGTKLTCIVRVR